MTPKKITRLTAQNFMRLKAVDISPNGDIIYITGANGEGKSSLLNAICSALNWRESSSSIPEPIRKGETKAIVSIDLDDMVITRTWTPSGTQLKVENKKGAVFKSPQAMLDKFFSRIGFDPFAFIRMQPRDQRNTLMELLGLDFSELEKEKEELLKEKLSKGNQYRSLEMQISELPPINENIPDHEISSTDLIKQIQEAQAFNQKLKNASNEYSELTRICIQLEDEIKRLQKQFDDLFLKRETHIWNQLMDEEYKDISSLQEQLSNIENINRQARVKQQAKLITSRMVEAEKELNKVEEAIQDIDQDKKDALEAATFPIKGLSFDESGVLFNGVSLKQASSAEQIRISLAIGIAMNPSLKVMLIRDGSLLDSKTRSLVADMAAENEMQVWIEAVDESGKVGFTIEDGTVKVHRPEGQQAIE